MAGLVAEIQHYCIQDGPGVRTTVFLKGCPLQCQWCHNPEMITREKEVWYSGRLCTFCGSCVKACPTGAMKGHAEGRTIDRAACLAGTGCSKCVEACPRSALELVGKERTAEEVTEEVLRDAPFYRRSGGGACLSGGEPLMQAEFAVEFLRLCQSRLISTSVETCCHVNPEVLREVSAYADYMLTDIKHMDSARHREGTGVSNELILDNIAMLAAAGKKIRVRLPLIPGFNDSEENLKETAKFMKEHHIRYIDLLPFHATGGFKYDRLGMEYAYAEHRTPSSEEMSEYMALFERVGVGGTIGGTDIEPF